MKEATILMIEAMQPNKRMQTDQQTAARFVSR
jgi:hypothetical protein